MKGDPGMGKSTLGRKIGWDWARGIFKRYSIVFFVALKLVKPGDSIENGILQQHSELLGLKVSSRKISTILERFGDRCLLILDGLDEHGLGQNEDVLRIIRDEKLLDCGIIVSSRPHSTNEVKEYFPSIIRVDGFTSEKAKEFVSHFVTEETKITQIMDFKPSDSREDFPIHKCPILLSFLCLLVKESKIDLSDTKLRIGDLYFRMAQCLYKKFTNRIGIRFVKSDLVLITKSVGIIALKTLLPNNPLLQKSEVIEIVGDFAFELGFFTGHEDFRLCTDPTADIYVTYVHRSIEEFFGSFGFLQALDDGKSVDDILGSDCEKPIFMTNPLVLKFCLWLLSRQDLGFANRDEIYEKLVSYVVNSIDNRQFDPGVIAGEYPAIDIMKSVQEGNDPELAFFRKILEKCRQISMFHIRRVIFYKFDHLIDHTDWIFGCMNEEVLNKSTLVSIGKYLPPQDCPKTDTLTISIDIDLLAGSVLLDILLNKYDLRNRHPQVYLREEGRSDYNISAVISKHIKELHLQGDHHSTLMASGEIPFCPLLTCLKLQRFQIDPSVPSAFSKAVNDGKLPNLRRIELSLSHMNATNWPEVPEFCYKARDLDLAVPDPSDVQKLLSKLTCLTLQPSLLTRVDRLFPQQLTKLSILKLVGIEHKYYSELTTALKQAKLPNLSDLIVSGHTFYIYPVSDLHPEHMPRLEKLSLQRIIWSAGALRTLSDRLSSCQLRELDIRKNGGIEGCLSLLFTNSFPTLQSLKLGDFYSELNQEDMESLVLASEQGKLPNLRHLYLYPKDDTIHLFTGRANWNQLLTLCISSCNVLGLGSEYLASLQSLVLYPPDRRDLTITRCWPHLQTIKSTDEVLLSVVEGVRKGLFPALKAVKGYGFVSDDCIFKLHKANIRYIRYTKLK